MYLEIACNLISDFTGLLIAAGYNRTVHSDLFLKVCRKLNYTPTGNDFARFYTQTTSDYYGEGKPKDWLAFFKEKNTVSAFYDLWYSNLDEKEFAGEIERLQVHFTKNNPGVKGFDALAEAAVFNGIFENIVRESQDMSTRLHMQEMQVGFTGLLEKLNDLSGKMTAPPRRKTAKGPVYISITRRPPLASHLVLGRKEDLAAIDRHFAEGDTLLLLNGMGGVGKSTLAGHYMEQNAHRFRHIAWVRYTGSFAADCVRDIIDYEAIGLTQAQQAQLANSPPDAQFPLLMAALERLPRPNLLVVDNLNTQEDAADAARYQNQLPNGWKVLLTARERNGNFPHHPIGVLPLDEAHTLFLRHYESSVRSPQSSVGSPQSSVGSPQAAATSHPSPVTSYPSPITDHLDKLLEHLGRHTLVVEFAAKTAAAQGWTPEQLLDRLKKEGLTHLDTKAAVTTGHSRHERKRMAEYIAALFDINLHRLEEDERWLLANLSMLPAFAHAYTVLEEMLFYEDEEEEEENDDPGQAGSDPSQAANDPSQAATSSRYLFSVILRIPSNFLPFMGEHRRKTYP